MYDFADLAASNPTFYADLTDPQSLNKYQYCYNNPLAYTDPDGHKGLREWAKQAVQVAADFTVGVSQGVVASISYGVCSLCQASSNDSISRRAGQVLGTAIVGAQGSSMISAGGGALVLTGGALVPAYATVAVGTALAAGAAKNGVALATTPMQMAGSRHGAFKEAKRDAGVPVSQQPDKGGVNKVPMTDKNGKPVLGSDGKPITTREYTFTKGDKSKVVIQDHSAGHQYPGGVGNQGPHFNVRPAENTRTSKVPGTKEHYEFKE